MKTLKEKRAYDRKRQRQYRKDHPEKAYRWQRENRELYNKLQREWRKKNPERAREIQRAYIERDPERYRKQNLAKSKRAYHRLRDQVFELLGDKCVRCGFADRRALQFDHISGGGNRERMSRGGSNAALYRQILTAKGVGYQVLCANHNWIKRAERGEHGWRRREVGEWRKSLPNDKQK